MNDRAVDDFGQDRDHEGTRATSDHMGANPGQPSGELIFNKTLSDRPMPDFSDDSARNKYHFDQIPVGSYRRYPHAPSSVAAKKIMAAANSWARKNLGESVFRFEKAADHFCVWRVK